MTTRLIGSGTDATIELDEDDQIVYKQFRIVDTDRATALARREYDHLKRFSSRLRDQPYLHCPEPVGVRPDCGVLQMSYCPGQSLIDLLANSNENIEPDFEHIADQILIGVTCYTAEFNEAYDLATNNLQYDRDSRILYFLDFTQPSIFESAEPQQRHVESCLGGLIGFALYGTVRPETWTNRTGWRANQKFILTVLKRFAAHTHLNWDVVDEVCNAAYRYSGKQGSVHRRLWYATVGEVLFRRRKSALFSALHGDTQCQRARAV